MLDETSDSEQKSKKGWKKRLSDLLKELGFTNDKFKGEVIIKLNRGGVRSLDKKEEFE